MVKGNGKNVKAADPMNPHPVTLLVYEEGQSNLHHQMVLLIAVRELEYRAKIGSRARCVTDFLSSAVRRNWYATARDLV